MPKRQKVSRLGKMGSQKNYPSGPFLMKFEKVAKMAPLGVPGSKRHPKGMQRPPKGSQKVSRKHENDVQKASSIEFDKQLNKQFDRQCERQFNRQATRQCNRQFNRQFNGQATRQCNRQFHRQCHWQCNEFSGQCNLMANPTASDEAYE